MTERELIEEEIRRLLSFAEKALIKIQRDQKMIEKHMSRSGDWSLIMKSCEKRQGLV